MSTTIDARTDPFAAKHPEVMLGYLSALQDGPKGLTMHDARKLRSLAYCIAEETGAPLTAGWMLRLAERIEVAAGGS